LNNFNLASFEGNHGLILPLDEKTYKRLSMLQDALINSIPFKGGTNPKAFRALKSNHSDFKQTKKNIIDLEPLFQYNLILLLKN
jgi:cleavage and polyadenylation specificity factor subunit 1